MATPSGQPPRPMPAALRAEGIDARVEPGGSQGKDSPATQTVRAALDPRGGVCLEVTGPDSGGVIYVKLLGLMRPGGRRRFATGAGSPEDPSPPDRVRGRL